MLNPFRAKHLISGDSAEEKAHLYLIAQGLKPVTRNFRCRLGELDLIMKDGESLVIIEVRYRKSNRYGNASESITPKKQKRIIAAAGLYLSQHPTKDPIRFDVVAISGETDIQWIKNAFLT